MDDEKLDAIARMVLTTREHVVRIRPHARLLTVDVLEYATQVKDPAAFKEDSLDTSPSAPERKLTRQLITSMVDDQPDLSRYADVYTDRIRELIEARVQGKEIVTAAPAEEPHVVNLMDALKQSVRRAHTSKRATKMSRRPAPSVARRTTSKSAPRRRKSG